MMPRGLGKQWLKVSLVGLMASVLAATEGRAGNEYPDRQVRLVVEFAPGGSSDTAARLVAERLAQKLGQPGIVENKPGAGGMNATTQLLREPADGYSLLLLASAHSVAAAVRANLPFDPVHGLECISTVATYGMVFGVRPDSPSSSLAEIVAAAKAKPGSISFYSIGLRTGHHLLGDWLNAATGAQLLRVLYRASSQALTDSLGGRVDLTIVR
jgi:tripartite-type tricarboxylate transporter receptor subunit TctC